MLSSIKLKKNNKTIPVNVPVGAYFIHKCYIECARNFWRKAWLLDNTARSIDIQRNVSDSERLIQESIKETSTTSVNSNLSDYKDFAPPSDTSKADTNEVLYNLNDVRSLYC